MTARQWRRLLLLTLWGVAQCVFLLSYVFSIRFIKVDGNVLMPSEKIIEASSMRAGEYYWEYWLEGWPNRIGNLPQLTSYSVYLAPGGIVHITVNERKAVAQVATRDSQHPWVGVDMLGNILGPVTDSNSKLPKIKLFRGVPLEGRIPVETIDKFNLIEETCNKVFGDALLSYGYDNTQQIVIEANILGRTTPVLIGEAKDFMKKAKLAYAILATVRKDGKPVKQIDLRYTNPVVALVNPPKPSPSPSPESGGVSSSESEDTEPENVPVENYVEYAEDAPPADNISAEEYYTPNQAPAEEPYYPEPAPAEEPYYEPAPEEPAYAPAEEPYYPEPAPETTDNY